LPPPKIYLFRGAMGPFFSTGMDRLEEKLTQAGFSANVYEFTICRWIGERAISSYKETPAPIVLIHDWVWRRRGAAGTRVSWWLLKRVNIARRASRAARPAEGSRAA
jgi:hypothetical protein